MTTVADTDYTLDTDMSGRQVRKTVEWVGWGIVITLLALALVSVVNRMWFMSSVDDVSVLNDFDRRYAEQSIATWLHLIPALLIAITGPCQFIRKIRVRNRLWHRVSGRVYLVCGTIAALSGTYVGVLYPFTGYEGPGFNEAMASLFFGLISLFCLFNAYRTVRARDFARHREWVIRSWALMLAIATERTLLGIFAVTTNIDLAHLFGVTFWMAGAINIPAAEYWIHLTRKASTTARHWKDIDGR